MIVHIQGEIVHQNENSLTVRMGGLGVQVFTTQVTARQHAAGEVIFLHSHLVVREDGWSLYGFETESERDFFVLLLGVNGIGPRLALMVLSTLSVDAIRRAVLSEQADVFARVPGLGRKTAQKVLLHLQGKVGQPGVVGEGLPISDVDTEVLEALTGLGYSVVEAQTAIQSLPRDSGQDVEERLRLALMFFSR